MAHELEVSGNEVAFASLRQPAWHGLGTVFDEPVSTSRMLELAHLANWNVRLESVAEAFPSYSFVQVPYIVVRDNPFTPGQVDVLGQVGERYAEFQNEDLFEFAGNVLDGAGQWETAGSIKNGRQVFGSMSIDQSVITLDPSGAADKVNVYMLAHSSHDGSQAIVFAITPVRVVCQNTLNLAMRGVKQSFKIRHTKGMTAKVEDARKQLGIIPTYVAEFEAEARALFETAITDKQFHELINAVYPEPAVDAPKGAHVKWENKRDALVDIYHGPTCETIKGSAWGAFNALTERLDWGRKPRSGNTENMFAAASGFDLVTNVTKNDMLKITQELFLSTSKPKRAKASA